MEIGSVIREKRTAQGLTQEQVAHGPGVSAPAVSKWEREFPKVKDTIPKSTLTLLPEHALLCGYWNRVPVLSYLS